MPVPEVSLIVTSYQMPDHLRRVLASVACQTVFEKMEVIVTDDGSTDSTPQVVKEFSQRTGRPARFVTHAHAGFHLTRCRNDGVRASTSPYLIFLDGDCVIPRDHVEQYLLARRRGYAHFGYCCRIDRETSERVTEAEIAVGKLDRFASRKELRKITTMYFKSLFYQWLGHRDKPALKGGNVGIWRSDYELVNGYDENFRDWGCEDDDFGRRLRAAGLKVATILGRTHTHHLWHPPATTRPPQKWHEGPNVAYLQRRGRLTTCMNGFRKRTLRDLHVRVTGTSSNSRQSRWFMDTAFGGMSGKAGQAEIEVLFHPSTGTFSGESHCRVLVHEANAPPPKKMAATADVVVPCSPQGIEQLEFALCRRETDHVATRRAA